MFLHNNVLQYSSIYTYSTSRLSIRTKKSAHMQAGPSKMANTVQYNL